jgi:photosystem II stability/assembly factor-like uncharacterized protein
MSGCQGQERNPPCGIAASRQAGLAARSGGAHSRPAVPGGSPRGAARRAARALLVAAGLAGANLAGANQVMAAPAGAAAAGEVAAGAAAAWQSVGPFGAPVLSLAQVPGQPQVLFAGASSGLFKSSDGGASWMPLSLSLDEAVNAVVVIPGEPPVVLAASGNGIFRSADGGATWQTVPIEAGGNRIFEFQALAVDPRQPATVYAGAGLIGDGATASGLFKSTDGGATFLPADRGIADSVVSAIAIDPFNPQIVYAASPQPSILVSTQQPTGVLKSLDGGATWQEQNRGLRLPPDEAFGLQPGVIQVVADPEAAGTLYAVVGASGRVYRSRNGAASWQALPPGPAATALVVGHGGVLYIGGALPGQAPTVWRSLDGGRRWMRTAAPAPAILLAPASEPPNARHGGGGAAADTLFAASGGGLAVSSDGGATWRVADTGLTSIEIGLLAASQGRTYATSGALLYRGTARATSWVQLAVPPPNPAEPLPLADLAVDPRDFARLFTVIDTQLLQSQTAGRRWRQVPLPDATCVELSTVVLAPSDAQTVYAGGSPLFGTNNTPPPCTGGCQSFRSRDGGATWTCLPLAGVQRFLVDPADAETVYAVEPILPGVSLDSDLAKSTDGGQTWQAMRPGNLGFGAGSWILVTDPANSLHLYAALNRMVWESLDGGQTWQTKGQGIPNLPADFNAIPVSILVDPRDSSVLYASVMPTGVFRSADGGLTWQPLDHGLPPGATVEGGALALDPTSPGFLYLGTGDRGVYRLAVPLPAPPS